MEGVVANRERAIRDENGRGQWAVAEIESARSWTDVARRRTQRMLGRVVHGDVVHLRLLFSAARSGCGVTSWRSVAVSQMMLMRWMRSHDVVVCEEAARRRFNSIRLARF
ncbi:Uncharacterized protein APZ42_020587 [Daphnia magna]|uniref:Uncharacterized protein n=1 Tax=Daphnia magna TaxID=35525 RepID=A0A164X7H8_9CRUS|nr:Uncharacterized protein APZ42_020587 [Daphnia magna]